ncbi:uncharacterized protein LOC122864353 [Siniperca chuatsi]|uniref:uncharacterized protein LOC122864353 n=1 Tax=Siniperca chuatsi TaxID=119488 RepID=UPI001CE09659|nr:uncharacterized protein LOC122864353 [Siniperca chuatsi]
MNKMKPLSTIVKLTVLISIPAHALLDSRSAGNFISGALCRQLKLQTTTTPSIYKIHSVTGQPLSRNHVQLSAGPVTLQVGLLHEEQQHLLVLEDSTLPVILGCPWLEQHNPIISWTTGKILKIDTCFPDCFLHRPQPHAPCSEMLPVYSTSIESPVEKQSVDVPSCYASSVMFYALRKSQSCLHTGHGPALSIYFPVSQCPAGRYTHYPSLSRRLWRNISVKHYTKAISVPPLPLLLPVSSLWPKRTEDCDLSTTGASTKSLLSSVIHLPSSQRLWNIFHCHCHCLQVGPLQRLQPHSNT